MKERDFLDRLEKILDRHHCACDDEPPAGVARQVWCDPCPPLAPVRQQYEQTLARYNDQVSATASQAQAAQLAAYQAWSAHMIKLQADVTNPSTA